VACARAIIVSKGRVVADGPLDEIRAKSGKVRYVVTIHEKRVFEGGGPAAAKKAPSAQEVQEALKGLPGVTQVSELPTDDKAHSFQLMGALNGDIRPEIFALVVAKGWLLLEMRRDAQSLEGVFKALTKGDELRDRGRTADPDDVEAGDAADDEEDEDEDDEDEKDEASDDEDEDEDEDEAEEAKAGGKDQKAGKKD